MISPTLSESRRNSLASKAERYHHDLLGPDGTPSRDYWLGRGLPVEAVIDFQIGHVLDGPYTGRLSIPYLTPSGLPWTVKYRCTVHADCKTVGCAKYLYDTGSEHHLFNAGVLEETPPLVVLTEGELDAIAVQSIVGVPAVGYPGVQAWQKMRHLPYCFTDIVDVVVMGDAGDAGVKSARDIAATIPQARVVLIPDGDDDCNMFLQRHGPEAFRKLAEL